MAHVTDARQPYHKSLSRCVLIWEVCLWMSQPDMYRQTTEPPNNVLPINGDHIEQALRVMSDLAQLQDIMAIAKW